MITIGSVVRLKSGGPDMVILNHDPHEAFYLGIPLQNPVVEVGYFVANQLVRETVLLSALEPVDKDEEQTPKTYSHVYDPEIRFDYTMMFQTYVAPEVNQ